MQQPPVSETLFGWFTVHSFSSQPDGPFMALLRSPQFIIIEFLFNIANKSHLGIANIKGICFWIGIDLITLSNFT